MATRIHYKNLFIVILVCLLTVATCGGIGAAATQLTIDLIRG